VAGNKDLFGKALFGSSRITACMFTILLRLGVGSKMAEDNEVVQYVIHPALRPTIDRFLKSLGYETIAVAEASLEELATFVISPTDELLKRARHYEA
jgi:hypothetical protein